MGNIIRLSNGGQIQVRTGVLAGIGPMGPRGLVGPSGPEGPQGPEGPEGPIGQILQVQSRALVSGATTVLPNTDTQVAFGTVGYDDLGVFRSSTTFRFAQLGDYQISCWVNFTAPGGGGATGARTISLVSVTNGTIAKATVPATTTDTAHHLEFPFRTTIPDEEIRVLVRSSDPLQVTVSEGALLVTRIGSGPQGVAGPVGPQGPQGPQGVAGPQGPTGSASSGYATYNDLM